MYINSNKVFGESHSSAHQTACLTTCDWISLPHLLCKVACTLLTQIKCGTNVIFVRNNVGYVINTESSI